MTTDAHPVADPAPPRPQSRQPRRRRRRVGRRVLAVVLSVASVAGVLLFSPDKARLRLQGAQDALSLQGLPGAEDKLLKEWVAVVQKSSAADTAATWRAMSAADRASARKDMPVVAGNLGGLPYWLRDELNRKALTERMTRIRRFLEKSPDDRDARTTLAAYEAIAGAIRPNRPKRYLVTLTADDPPLAAISVGSLDNATDATWLIPGMGTYTTDMKLWALAAQNLYAVQGTVGATRNRAVVAWMGYEPPPPPPSLEVTLGDYAVAGAPHLIRDLDDFRATRGRGIAGVTMDLVAHSYGTTMAADALVGKDLGIDTVVMLGSAGVEQSIPDAAALHAKRVYVTQAEKDTLADLGRLSRRDPGAPEFGATWFGSDGDRKEHLDGVTGHAPILHSAWNDNIASALWTKITDTVQRLLEFKQHKASFGYLDRKTESLANVATLTASPGSKREVTGTR